MVSWDRSCPWGRRWWSVSPRRSGPVLSSERGKASAEIAGSGDQNSIELQPAGHQVQLGRQGFDEVRYAGFRCDSWDEQGRVPAIGLQIDSSNKPVAEQERQHVVAVHPLRRGRIYADPVEEVEQLVRAVTVPDQG